MQIKFNWCSVKFFRAFHGYAASGFIPVGGENMEGFMPKGER